MKKVILVIVGLLLICCCCTVVGGVLLFTSPSGYIDFNGRCFHRGAQSNPKTGPCASMMGDFDNNSSSNTNTAPAPQAQPQPQTTTSKTYSGLNSDEYTFTYPKNYFLDDGSSVVYVYSKDPSLKVTGDLNDNINITSASTAMVVNQKNCTSYANELIAGVGTSLNVDKTSLETKIDTINGLDVCAVRWDAQVSGVGIKQEQYVFSDTAKDKNYIVTVSLASSSTNADIFTDIVYSFETK